MEERNTILGLQNIVRKVYVEVVERNNELAALRNYTTGAPVVAATTKSLQEGARAYSGMKIRKAVLLWHARFPGDRCLVCGEAVGSLSAGFGALRRAGHGRQLEALRSALRQEDGASALVPALEPGRGSAESRWETCGITAILYCGEYDAVYPAVLLRAVPAAQENGKCAVSTAAAWQLWGSEDVLGQELEIEGDIYRVCGLFRSSASLALCGESLDHGFSNIEFWRLRCAAGGDGAAALRAAGIAQQVTLYFFPLDGRPDGLCPLGGAGAAGRPPLGGRVAGAQRKRAGLFWRRFVCARPACPATVAPALITPPGGATFLLGGFAARSGQSHRNRLFPEPLCQGMSSPNGTRWASHCRNARQCCGRKADAQQAAKLHKFMKPIHLILRIIFVR